MWQVSITAAAETEEAVASLLERQFQKPVSVYWHEPTGRSTATVYLSKLPASGASLRAGLRRALREIAACGLNTRRAKIVVKPLPSENWAHSWKRHFKPIAIGRALLIKPGWSRRRPRPGQQVVVLDPGLSFGTGHHPTTLFCLRRIARCRDVSRRQSLLDIGSGSGILAIAAAKLGYAPVAAFDFDPVAVRVSRQNVKKNNVGHVVRPRRQDLTRLARGKARQYDVVCANLTADLLVSEAAAICARVKPGGRLIVAGVRDSQFAGVQKILQKFRLTLEAKLSDKKWRSGQFVLSSRRRN